MDKGTARSHPNEYNPMDKLSPSINSFFRDLVQTPRALFDNYVLPPDDGAAIAQAISMGTAVAVSDGSYDDSRKAGSSVFIIASIKDEGTVCLEGLNFVTGLPDKQSSYRSEFAGVLGVLTCVEALVKF